MLIGLVGPARVGKDTVGDLLQLHHGFRRKAFADKVKEMALAIDPWVEIDYRQTVRLSQVTVFGADVGTRLWWDAAKLYPDVRLLLQRLGTEGGRQVLGEHVWAKACLPGPPDHPTVVTDVRFVSEAEHIRLLGGRLVLVERPGHRFGNGSSHVSEQEWRRIPVHDVIQNNAGLDELAVRVAVMVEALEGVK